MTPSGLFSFNPFTFGLFDRKRRELGNPRDPMPFKWMGPLCLGMGMDYINWIDIVLHIFHPKDTSSTFRVSFWKERRPYFYLPCFTRVIQTYFPIHYINNLLRCHCSLHSLSTTTSVDDTRLKTRLLVSWDFSPSFTLRLLGLDHY